MYCKDNNALWAFGCLLGRLPGHLAILKGGTLWEPWQNCATSNAEMSRTKLTAGTGQGRHVSPGLYEPEMALWRL